MPAGEQAPLVRTLRAQIDPIATVGNDATTVVDEVAPFDGTVTAVTYTPVSTITGAASNNRTIAVVNKGQAGSGNTSVASLNFGNGTNATGGTPKAITLSGTPANLAVAAGDVLEVTSTHIGTGIADPGGAIDISVSRS